LRSLFNARLCSGSNGLFVTHKKHNSAIAAIVLTRLWIQRRMLVLCCAAAVIVGFIQPHGIAGRMFFCSLLGVAVALAQRGDDGLRQLEICEQSAPLFGRERARATALVPCIMATAATLAYWLGQSICGFAATPASFITALAAVLAATLIALSATLRQKSARWLYVLLAFAVAVITYFLAAYLSISGMILAIALCGLVSIIALRQYGEALARYDPIPY
jgi:hypothetical protein